MAKSKVSDPKNWTNSEVKNWLKKVSKDAQEIIQQKGKEGIDECSNVFNALTKAAKAAKKEFKKQHSKNEKKI